MRAIHETRTKEPLCETYVGAHRDASILNGIIVSDTPDIEMEYESWTDTDKSKLKKEKISWVDIPRHKVQSAFYGIKNFVSVEYFAFLIRVYARTYIRIKHLFLGDLSSCIVVGNPKI